VNCSSKKKKNLLCFFLTHSSFPGFVTLISATNLFTLLLFFGLDIFGLCIQAIMFLPALQPLVQTVAAKTRRRATLLAQMLGVPNATSVDASRKYCANCLQKFDD
jgi:hypothetical protein